jgi:hypothetical protein
MASQLAKRRRSMSVLQAAPAPAAGTHHGECAEGAAAADRRRCTTPPAESTIGLTLRSHAQTVSKRRPISYRILKSLVQIGVKAMARKGKTVKAVAYLRTSSAANVDTDKDSDKRQRAAIAAFCRGSAYEVVDEFCDAAVSGTDPIETRPYSASAVSPMIA